jgi:DNA-binding beta-propeller fold protein YncE
MARWLTGRQRLLFLLILGVLLVSAGIGAAVYKKIINRRHHAQVIDEFFEPPALASPLDPAPLMLAPGLKTGTITDCASTKPLDQTYPVNIVGLGDNKYYVCNYRQLCLINLVNRTGQVVPPPDGLPSDWVPTGLAYEPVSKRLFVANYTGGNVLVLDASDRLRLKLLATLTHPEMKGPEGVAVTADGKCLAIADYDSSATLFFSTAGKLLWKFTASQCHGVDILKARDGREYVLATSLGWMAVLKFDLDGNLLKKVVNRIWHGGHGYLYPTAIMTRSDGLIAVTDAFRGQVSFLDEDLEAFGTLGGNGPGPGFFNNPYASCWSGSEKLLVADTFRDRLVEINLKTRTVTAIYHLADPARENTLSSMAWWAGKSEIGSLTYSWSTPDLNLVPADPFGRNHIVHRVGDFMLIPDTQKVVALPLPHFLATGGKALGSAWRPGIQGLISVAKPGVCAWTVSLGSLLTDYPYRFILGCNYEHEGENYLLLSSPQSGTVLVSGRGATVAVPVHKDMWLMGNTLVGPNFALPARNVLARGVSRISAYHDLLANRPPLDALRSLFFPGLTREEFRRAFLTSMVSPDGAAFAQECWDAPDAQGQRAAAERFLATCQGQGMLQLNEILLAEMILCESK